MKSNQFSKAQNNSSPDNLGFKDYFDIYHSPKHRLDADQYYAEDIDGISEGLYGSANIVYAGLQSAQINGTISSDAITTIPASMGYEGLTTLPQGANILQDISPAVNQLYSAFRPDETTAYNESISDAISQQQAISGDYASEGQYSNTTAAPIAATQLQGNNGMFAGSNNSQSASQSSQNSNHTSTTVKNSQSNSSHSEAAQGQLSEVGYNHITEVNNNYYYEENNTTNNNYYEENNTINNYNENYIVNNLIEINEVINNLYDVVENINVQLTHHTKHIIDSAVDVLGDSIKIIETNLNSFCEVSLEKLLSLSDGIVESLVDSASTNSAVTLDLTSGLINISASISATDLLSGNAGVAIDISSLTHIISQTYAGGNSDITDMLGKIETIISDNSGITIISDELLSGPSNDTDISVTPDIEMPVIDSLLASGTNVTIDPIEDLVGDIDVGAGVGLAPSSNDESESDQDINIAVDSDIVGVDLLDVNADINLNFVEKFTGDLDVNLDISQNLLGDKADPLIDDENGGSGEANILSDIGQNLAEVVESGITMEPETLMANFHYDGSESPFVIIPTFNEEDFEQVSTIITAELDSVEDLIRQIEGSDKLSMDEPAALNWTETIDKGANLYDALSQAGDNLESILPDPLSSIHDSIGTLDVDNVDSGLHNLNAFC